MQQHFKEVNELILCEGGFWFKRDPKVKWEKIWVRLFISHQLNTGLRVMRSRYSKRNIGTIKITKELLVIGPVPDKDEKKIVFHLTDGKIQVQLASESRTLIIGWTDIISSISEVMRDPSKCEDPKALDSVLPKIEDLKQKMSADDNGVFSHILGQFSDDTGVTAKLVENAKLELKKLRPLTWLEKEPFLNDTISALSEKIIDNRDRVIHELAKTEQTYVCSLNILLHVFKHPFEKYQKELGLQDEQIFTLFSNIEEIVQIHTLYLTELIECLNGSSQQLLSDCLKKGAKSLKIYRTYSANFEAAGELQKVLLKKAHIKAFIETLAEDPLCKGLTLGAFLIMPIQRIPRYILLLNEIIKHTPQDHTEFQLLVEARDEFKTLASEIDLAPQALEEIELTMRVIKGIDKHKDHKLMKRGRIFIHQGWLTKVSQKGDMKTRQYFLFSDLLLYAEKSFSTKWIIQRKFVWNTLSVVEDKYHDYAFKIVTDTSSCLFLARSADEKKNWKEYFGKVAVAAERALSTVQAPSLWIAVTKSCMLCLKHFTQSRRRNRCNQCGWIVCSHCVNSTKLCDNCRDMTVDKKSTGTETSTNGNDEVAITSLDSLNNDEMPDPYYDEKSDTSSEDETVGEMDGSEVVPKSKILNTFKTLKRSLSKKDTLFPGKSRDKKGIHDKENDLPIQPLSSIVNRLKVNECASIPSYSVPVLPFRMVHSNTQPNTFKLKSNISEISIPEISTPGEKSNISEISTTGENSNITETSTPDKKSNISEISTPGEKSNISEISTTDISTPGEKSNINKISTPGEKSNISEISSTDISTPGEKSNITKTSTPEISPPSDKSNITKTSTTTNGGGEKSKIEETLTLELMVLRRVIHLVHNNEFEMGRYKSTHVPQVALDIWQWMLSEESFLVSNSHYFSLLNKSIQSVTSKKSATYDAIAYWLSATCALCSLASAPNSKIQQLEKALNKLFISIYKNTITRFTQLISPHTVSIFTKSSSSKPKRNGSYINWHHPSSYQNLPWELGDLLQLMSELLTAFCKFNVPIDCVKSLFGIFIESVSRWMFNSLLSMEDLCTADNGFQIKLTVSLLEQWLTSNEVKACIGDVRTHLVTLSEVATLLTLSKQVLLDDKSILSLVCPSLSVGQIQRIMAHSKGEEGDTSFLKGLDLRGFLDWLHLSGTETVPTPEEVCLAEVGVRFNQPVSLLYRHWVEVPTTGNDK